MLPTAENVVHVTSPVPEPEVRLVLDYLADTEAGRLEEARAALAAGARLVFPGGREFSDLGEWLTYFRSRMVWIRKCGNAVDVCRGHGGDLTIYVRGLLEGETVTGATFDDVRFIDRFHVVDGEILNQQVWNDLAVRGLEPTPQRQFPNRDE